MREGEGEGEREIEVRPQLLIHTRSYYVQAVNNVTNGKFPLTQELATRLAALQLLIKCGDHNAQKATEAINSKNIDQFVSKNLLEILNLSASAIKSWLELIVLSWTALAGTSAAEAKSQFLQQMRTWKLYGSMIFAVEVSVDEEK
jgi:hypothetical protein